MSENFENVPDELKERDQWLMWDQSNDTPKQPHWRGKFSISWSDPDDWHSFEEAVEAAAEKDSWGIGYVMAQDNDDYARGLYSCLDLDGCLESRSSPKDWLPSLEPFIEDDAYIEYSPSGDGLHIPLVGQDIPDWWTDSHLTDEEHEGVDVLTNKFCTFTSDILESHEADGVSDVDPTPWLHNAYHALNGEYPRTEAEDDGKSDYSNDEWGRDEIKEALNTLDSNCAYPKWRNLAFAVHDWDSSTTGKSLFEQWSRGGGWDEQSQQYIDQIWANSEEGNGVTVGTLIHHAMEAGWQPSGSTREKPTIKDEVEENDGNDTAEAETDGGTASESAPQEASTPSPSIENDRATRVRRRILNRVVTPLDPPDNWEGEEVDKRTAAHRTAEIYAEEYAWLRPRSDTQGWRATLYNYVDEEGIYEPHGRAEIERMIDRHLGPAADNQFVNEVAGKIERKSRVRARRLDAEPERIVVRNGILDLTTGDLDEHDPGEYHRTMLDVEYDPDADCENIDGFLHDVVHESDVGKLYRFIAHSLYRGYPEAKAAMLLGEGRNGKTTFLNLVEQFLGDYNVSHESLKKVNEHEWAPARLNGKLANIDADMSDQSPDSMGMFKRLTGGDPIHAEVKFEEPIKFTNHATMMFACNEMPVLADDTRGNWRRWQLIKFPYVFDDADPAAKDEVPVDELEAQLFTDEQFSGLLAKCVEEIREWDNGRDFFPTADSWEKTRSKMRRAAEPVYDFAHACLRPAEDEDAHIKKEELRQVYQQYATENGLTKLGPEEFGKRLLGLQDFSIDTARPRDGKRRITAYTGIEFSPRGRQIADGEDPTDERQSNLEEASGRRADIGRVRKVLEENSGGMKRPDLYAKLGDRFDISPEEAEEQLDKAMETGAVRMDGDGLIRDNA